MNNFPLQLILSINILGFSDLEKSKIAEAYAPVIIYDSRETHPATSVESALSNKKLSNNFFNSIKNKNQTDLGEVSIPLNTTSLISKTAYYNIVEDPYFITIQYWFFHTWNETSHLGGGEIMAKCGNHQGDWEHLSVRVNRFKLVTGNSYFNSIDDIYFSQHHRGQHDDRKYFRRNSPKLSFQGSHILAFSALGSHALYPSTGDWYLMSVGPFKLHDINNGKGVVFQTQKYLIPIKKKAWHAFPGKWGKMQNDFCNIFEAISFVSNDGQYGPGHKDKKLPFYKSDWYDHYRAISN